MGTSDRLRTIVVDDDPLAARSVKEALRSDGITVIGEARDARTGIELARHYRPEVVLLDVVMPGMDGIEACRRITQTPGVSVILLTAHDDPDLAVLGMRAGAVGFLHKQIDLGALPRAVRGVVEGEAAVSRRLTRALIDRVRATREGTSGLRPVRSVLSDREWQVLDLLCDGASTERIADDLVLSTETVRSHVKSILRKLGVSSRADAVRVARQLRGDADAHSLIAGAA